MFTSEYYASLCRHSIKCNEFYDDKQVDTQENYLSLVRETDIRSFSKLVSEPGIHSELKQA